MRSRGSVRLVAAYPTDAVLNARRCRALDLVWVRLIEVEKCWAAATAVRVASADNLPTNGYVLAGVTFGFGCRKILLSE